MMIIYSRPFWTIRMLNINKSTPWGPPCTANFKVVTESKYFLLSSSSSIYLSFFLSLFRSLLCTDKEDAAEEKEKKYNKRIHFSKSHHHRHQTHQHVGLFTRAEFIIQSPLIAWLRLITQSLEQSIIIICLSDCLAVSQSLSISVYMCNKLKLHSLSFLAPTIPRYRWVHAWECGAYFSNGQCTYASPSVLVTFVALATSGTVNWQWLLFRWK